MVGTAKYGLTELKNLVLRYRAGEDTLWFSAPSRSIDYVVQVVACDEQKAEEMILAGLCLLEPGDFSSRVMQWDMLCDVYGLENSEGHKWYVKFALSQDDSLPVLEQISFHPLEKDLKVADGRYLKVTFIPS